MEIKEQSLEGKEIEYSLIATANDCKWKLRCASNAIEEFISGNKDRDYDSVVRAINRALEIDVITYPSFLYTEESRKAYNEFLENLYNFVLCESVIDKSSIYDLDNVKRFMKVRVQKQINDFENKSMPYDVAMRLSELEKENTLDKYLDRTLMGLLYFNNTSITREQAEKVIDEELEKSFKRINEIDKKIEPIKKSNNIFKKSLLRVSIIAGTIFLSASSLLFFKHKKTSSLKYTTQTIYEDLTFTDVETIYETHDNSKPVEKERTIVRVYSPVVNGEFTESIYDYTDSGVSNNNLLNGELSDVYLVGRTTHSITEYPEEIMNVYKDITSENRVVTKSKTNGSKGLTTYQMILLLIAYSSLYFVGIQAGTTLPWMSSNKKSLNEYLKEKELENEHIVAISTPTYKLPETIEVDKQLKEEKDKRKLLERRP